MLKAGAIIVPGDVYSGGMKGFILYFKDDMTPWPFEEDCWKVTPRMHVSKAKATS
jgi:hypothetical protein